MVEQEPNFSRIGETMRALAMRASIEMSARELRKPGDVAVALLRGRETFLPWTPNLTADAMVEATSSARSLGLTPVPHVVARRLGSEAAAQSLLARLAGAGAQTVLLVGGDVADPAGPYRSSFDLLRTGLLQRAGFRKIGVAGYPEGHPAMDDSIIRDNLDLKLDYARSEGLEVFIVSQFCFDGSAIVEWAKRLRVRGVTAQIRVGVAGPTNLAKLLELGLRCGVGNSIRALKGKMGSVARLLAPHEPQEVIEAIAAACLAAPSPDALSLHLFAFGGAGMTAQWMERIVKRSIDLDSARSGVRVGG
jgi:methylenetetrahydrofolate reductase (NADPH)